MDCDFKVCNFLCQARIRLFDEHLSVYLSIYLSALASPCQPYIVFEQFEWPLQHWGWSRKSLSFCMRTTLQSIPVKRSWQSLPATFSSFQKATQENLFCRRASARCFVSFSTGQLCLSSGVDATFMFAWYNKRVNRGL